MPELRNTPSRQLRQPNLPTPAPIRRSLFTLAAPTISDFSSEPHPTGATTLDIEALAERVHRRLQAPAGESRKVSPDAPRVLASGPS